MINWALKYQRLGFSVIPLKPRSKEPLVNWLEFQTRLASEEEIRQWWNAVPSANIGIVTGKISNLAVIDLDGEKAIQKAKELNLNSSVISTTGEGQHLWYRYSENLRNSASKIAEGIDVRGEGGFVLTPPSVHPNGRRYRWLKPFTLLKNLDSFPTSLIQTVSIAKNFKNKKEENWISQALEDMKNGHVHNNLVSVLGKFRYHGFSMGDTISLLKPYAYENGQPFEGLEEKVGEIWERYEPSNRQFDTGRDRLCSSGGLVIHSPSNAKSIEQFEQRNRLESLEPENRLQTGYKKLDEMLQGGLKSSRLFTLAARTGVGKTNWLIGIARTLCESGKRVLLFSTEMSYEEIWQRYIPTLADAKEFRNHSLFICDGFAPNINEVEEAIKEIKPDVFMFDHINHVAEDVRPLGEFMQGLNYLRRKYDCAGIVTAQLNRSADWVDLKTGEKVTPRMSMIKGSGTIEQASSRVLLLSETRVTPEMTEIIGNLDKNDKGTKGLVHFGLLTNPWKMIEL